MFDLVEVVNFSTYVVDIIMDFTILNQIPRFAETSENLFFVCDDVLIECGMRHRRYDHSSLDPRYLGALQHLLGCQCNHDELNNLLKL